MKKLTRILALISAICLVFSMTSCEKKSFTSVTEGEFLDGVDVHYSEHVNHGFTLEYGDVINIIFKMGRNPMYRSADQFADAPVVITLEENPYYEIVGPGEYSFDHFNSDEYLYADGNYPIEVTFQIKITSASLTEQSVVINVEYKTLEDSYPNRPSVVDGTVTKKYGMLKFTSSDDGIKIGF